ncbi:1,4-dihydroxy-2-naphthoate polyprenyltransferase [Ignavigranum ruoffiae]
MNESKKHSYINLSQFLEFVEIKTKLASFFPMLVGFLWSAYHYRHFNWINSLVFFIAASFFDMATTAINNTMDYLKAVDQEYKYKENVIGRHHLDINFIIFLLLAILSIAFVFSIHLVRLTDPILLLIGSIFYIIGITYTFGPLPTSRLPLGEILSGLTMGLGIFFLAIFVNNYSIILSTTWSSHFIQINVYWQECLRIVWLALPFVCLIANIMLANNICDLATDRLNQRFTLVHYIGKKWALVLYSVLSGLPWLFLMIYALSGLLPTWSLIFLIFVWPHYRSLQRFRQQQIKDQTFVESIKSFVLFSLVYSLSVGLALILTFL